MKFQNIKTKIARSSSTKHQRSPITMIDDVFSKQVLEAICIDDGDESYSSQRNGKDDDNKVTSSEQFANANKKVSEGNPKVDNLEHAYMHVC